MNPEKLANEAPDRAQAEQIMRDIENQKIAQASSMVANLNTLREQGFEANESVREGLEMLRGQIDGYLEK
jgi:hypothetical protein